MPEQWPPYSSADPVRVELAAAAVVGVAAGLQLFYLMFHVSSAAKCQQLYNGRCKPSVLIGRDEFAIQIWTHE